ncbi:MAG: TonB family protein [Acidobacteria bacterium]|nr:TonB family protein [Acidobacteriota bacterium]
MSFAATIPQENLKTPLVFSVAFHILLSAFALYANLQNSGGEQWGGAGGGSMTVGLVRNLPGIALPRPEVVTPSRVVDETRGLHKAEPRPKEPETPAKQIPEFEKNKRQRYITNPSKVLEDPTTPPDNAVPFGQGGAPALPYTQFQMSGGTQGGLGFTGPGGEFGSRFPWYVEAVRRRISSNWLLSTVDPGIRSAPRAVVQFQILRDGSVANIQMLHSSGIQSVDNSAVRAIRDSSPLQRLPSEYAGGFVAVEFWFDFKKQ